jgi:uncharacterized SAM-binding protein YcdF (DUF218 family)
MRQGPANPGELGRILLNLITLLCFVIFCAFLYVVRHPILRFVAESWIIEDPLDKADALIILGDDNFYADRATRGAQLYREGKAPVIVASGRRLRPNAGIAELMEHDLFERGVPRDKIVRFAHDADSTLEEARALTRLVKERKWRSVIVVTSNFHTRRVRYIFQRVFPQGMEVRVASARDGDFDPERWWEKRKSIKELMREFAGMVVTVWELRGRSETSETAQSVVELRGLIPQSVV